MGPSSCRTPTTPTGSSEGFGVDRRTQCLDAWVSLEGDFDRPHPRQEFHPRLPPLPKKSLSVAADCHAATALLP